MSGELRELYQEVILDHNRRPRNFRALDGASRHAEGYNPLCGDKITVYVQLDGDVIREASFQGFGCAISKASASMMTDALKGKTVAEAEALFDRFHRMVTLEPDRAVDVGALGKLAVFAGVREFPSRVKCASLAWHTLHAALEAKAEPVTTE
jgi:nitrogen fixation NifU-like protein